MSRFRWLEIKQSEAKPAPAGKDEYDSAFYLEQAREKFRNGEFEPSLRYYSRALEQEHLVEEAWIGQVKCLVELGEFSEAVVWADRALQLFPGNGSMLAAKALALGRKGEMDPALAASDASLKAEQDATGFAWWARGDLLIATNASAAEHCFRKAREACKNGPELSLSIAKTYISAGRSVEANRLLLSLQQSAQDNPQYWFFRGLSHERLGEEQKARNDYSRALAIRPNYEQAQKCLAALNEKGFLGKLVLKLRKIFPGR